MRPIQHPSNNRVFGAPKAWDQSTTECAPVPATVTDDGRIVIFWKPSQEELALLASGGSVGLHIWGGALPPHAMTIEKPF